MGLPANVSYQADSASASPDRRYGSAGKRVGPPLTSSDIGKPKPAKKAKSGKTGKGNGNGEASEPRVDKDEWNARIKANKCAGCGLSGHKFRVDGKRICVNKKNPAAHGTTASAVPLGLN